MEIRKIGHWMRNDLENRPSQGWLTVRFSYLPPNKFVVQLDNKNNSVV